MQPLHTVLAAGFVTVERPAAGDDIRLVVAAIADAMQAASAELADRIVARLCP